MQTKHRYGVAWVTLALVLAVVGMSREAHAQYSGHRFGAGFRLGDPTGLDGKFWLDGRSAVQVGFGWHARYRRLGVTYFFPGPTLWADWTHQVGRFGPKTQKVWFGMHIGIGASLGFVPNDCYTDAFGYTYCSNAITLRLPIAFNIYLSKVRFEFFAEVVPGLRLTPSARPTLLGSIGARYYF